MLAPWDERVRPEWIDYNGHLSEAYYVLIMGHATDAAMLQLGMTPEYLRRTGTSLFSLQAHVRYLDQIGPGADTQVRTSVADVGAKVVTFWHELFAEGRLRATEEVLMLHVDTVAARGVPFPEDLADRLRGLQVDVPQASGCVRSTGRGPGS